MKFRNFRESLFTKQEEIIINKKIKVQGEVNPLHGNK